MGRRVRRTLAALSTVALTLLVLPTGAASATPTVPTPAAPSSAPVAGGESAGDSLFPTIGNTGYDVTHYAIALRFASARSIRATTTVAATAAQPLSSFSLDLEGLEVDRVQVDGRTAAFSRSGTKLVITPAAAVAGAFEVSVRYHGAPKTHRDPDGAKDGWVKSSTGATALSEPVGAQTWFPNNNTPRDKATFDVSLDVPKKLAAASNGVLTSRRTKHGRTTWHWRQRQPMATYLTLLAIGRFDVHHSTVRLQDGRRIPVWSFVDPRLGPLTRQRARLVEAVAFSEQQYGPYPFDSVGLVAQKLGVGYALETQSRPFFDGKPDSSTIVHEVAHQWFGDSVTPRDWGDIWLNEGFASYAEDNWAAEHGGPSTWAAFGKVYDENDGSSALWSPAPHALTDPADLFGDPVYVRGGLTLEALREKVGDDTMRTLLRRWSSEHAYGVVDTADFVALAEQVSGQDLEAFFSRWLDEEGKPPGY